MEEKCVTRHLPERLFKNIKLSTRKILSQFDDQYLTSAVYLLSDSTSSKQRETGEIYSYLLLISPFLKFNSAQIISPNPIARIF